MENLGSSEASAQAAGQQKMLPGVGLSRRQATALEAVQRLHGRAQADRGLPGVPAAGALHYLVGLELPAKEHRFFRVDGDCEQGGHAEAAAWLAERPNRFLGTSLFGDRSRRAEAVVGRTLLGLDIDCQATSGHAAKDEHRRFTKKGAEEWMQACMDAGIVFELVQFTGGGYHAFLRVPQFAGETFGEPRHTARTKWAESVFTLLRKSAERAGGLLDATQDAARILRIPGGIRHKDGAEPVEVCEVLEDERLAAVEQHGPVDEGLLQRPGVRAFLGELEAASDNRSVQQRSSKTNAAAVPWNPGVECVLAALGIPTPEPRAGASSGGDVDHHRILPVCPFCGGMESGGGRASWHAHITARGRMMCFRSSCPLNRVGDRGQKATPEAWLKLAEELQQQGKLHCTPPEPLSPSLREELLERLKRGVKVAHLTARAAEGGIPLFPSNFKKLMRGDLRAQYFERDYLSGHMEQQMRLAAESAWSGSIATLAAPFGAGKTYTALEYIAASARSERFALVVRDHTLGEQIEREAIQALLRWGYSESEAGSMVQRFVGVITACKYRDLYEAAGQPDGWKESACRPCAFRDTCPALSKPRQAAKLWILTEDRMRSLSAEDLEGRLIVQDEMPAPVRSEEVRLLSLQKLKRNARNIVLAAARDGVRAERRESVDEDEKVVLDCISYLENVALQAKVLGCPQETCTARQLADFGYRIKVQEILRAEQRAGLDVEAAEKKFKRLGEILSAKRGGGYLEALVRMAQASTQGEECASAQVPAVQLDYTAQKQPQWMRGAQRQADMAGTPVDAGPLNTEAPPWIREAEKYPDWIMLQRLLDVWDSLRGKSNAATLTLKLPAEKAEDSDRGLLFTLGRANKLQRGTLLLDATVHTTPGTFAAMIPAGVQVQHFGLDAEHSPDTLRLFISSAKMSRTAKRSMGEPGWRHEVHKCLRRVEAHPAVRQHLEGQSQNLLGILTFRDEAKRWEQDGQAFADELASAAPGLLLARQVPVLGWFGLHERGSNAFEGTDVQLVLGNSTPSLDAAQADAVALGLPPEQLVEERKQAALAQAVGRDRGIRSRDGRRRVSIVVGETVPAGWVSGSYLQILPEEGREPVKRLAAEKWVLEQVAAGRCVRLGRSGGAEVDRDISIPSFAPPPPAGLTVYTVRRAARDLAAVGKVRLDKLPRPGQKPLEVAVAAQQPVQQPVRHPAPCQHPPAPLPAVRRWELNGRLERLMRNQGLWSQPCFDRVAGWERLWDLQTEGLQGEAKAAADVLRRLLAAVPPWPRQRVRPQPCAITLLRVRAFAQSTRPPRPKQGAA